MNKAKKHRKLRAFVEENDLKYIDIAKAMNMTPSRLSQKVNRSGSDFTLSEASRLCHLLGVSMDDIFFEDNIPKTGQLRQAT